MAQVLDEILDLAAVGDPVTCTLSPESVQVILFALPFIHRRKVWLGDPTDTLDEADWDAIEALIAGVSEEILP